MSNGAETKGFFISVGIILLGNILKLLDEDTGNLVQGIGIGSAVGTVAHVVDKKYTLKSPHHDVIGLVSLPVTYTLDKTGVINNKTIIYNLYGWGIGLTMEHLLAEGCSFCMTSYCDPGEGVC